MNELNVRQKVGRNIKAIAAIRGIPVPDLARRCGYNNTQVLYNRINGTATIGPDELAVIAEILEVDIADLFGDLVGQRMPWITKSPVRAA